MSESGSSKSSSSASGKESVSESPNESKGTQPSSAPQGKVSEYRLMIRESHLDTFGHVNNATYLVLFEEARWDIITQHGFGLKEIQARGLGPVILDIRLQFRKELRNREEIVIRTWTTGQNGKIQTLRQVMVNSKGEEACIADFTFGLFDTKARRLIDPTPEWLAALGMS